MNKNISITETTKWLGEHDNFLILTHIRPDGDTLGSAGALALGLRDLGKTAYLLTNHETTSRYAGFVEDCWAPDDFVPDHVIAVDTATTGLIPNNAAVYLDRIELCIDHHGSNTNYADLVCCCPQYAACGEIIYEILDQMLAAKSLKISKEAADCIYVAISTDTGCFCYRNTTANTHRVAAQVIELGASNKEISKKIFRTKRRARFKIESMVNSGMEFKYNGKVAMVVITRAMMEKSGADEDDIDDIANIPNSIEGVGIGITIREMTSPADCKISVRATPPYDASEICKVFGGGGHVAAAGATIKKTASEIKQDLIAVLEGYPSLRN